MHEQTITEFVHDIKTPVTAMKLLIDQEENQERKQALLFEWSRINSMFRCAIVYYEIRVAT